MDPRPRLTLRRVLLDRRPPLRWGVVGRPPPRMRRFWEQTRQRLGWR